MSDDQEEKAKPFLFSASSPEYGYNSKTFDTYEAAEKYAMKKAARDDNSWYVYQAIAKADCTTANVVVTKL